jgi:hypothetical protein
MQRRKWKRNYPPTFGKERDTRNIRSVDHKKEKEG